MSHFDLTSQICLGIAVLLVAPGAAVADPVVVTLRDGRQLSGHVNARTDERELWLHATEPSIVLLSAFDWADIESAAVNGQALSSDEFRRKALQLRAPVPVVPLREPEPAMPAKPPTPRIGSLDVYGSLGNWDADAEPDGLEIRVTPVTAAGDAVAVDAGVTVRLLGRQLGTPARLESRSGLGFWKGITSPRAYAARLDNLSYLELGRWNVRIRSEDATSTGYVVRVPFRTFHPEYDLDLIPDGQIDVRLTPRHQPAVHATAPVQLRSYSPLREELQLYRGTRFFPDEFRSR